MYLYPYEIFAISKNKRLLNPSEPWRTIGIYDAEKFDYLTACTIAGAPDYKVSVLLGEISRGIKLICLDLDDCIDNSTGKLEKQTEDFLKEFRKDEWEFSSSGIGIHIYILTKKDFETFIVKDLEGCKSFECYTNKRHIVTTTFDFLNTDLKIGIHDKFIEDLYNRVEEIKSKKKENSLAEQAKRIFDGKIVKSEQDINSAIFGRAPIIDMFKLRGCGYKDPILIELIDAEPSAVDQSAHDAKLITKLMYYCLSFDTAWEMAKKTNYYKHKDDRHKKKFDNETYKERTRKFIERGYN